MVSAEVLSGSSPLWFINGWSLLVTTPLYLLHVVVLFSVAVIYKKTHWLNLYALGVVLALYESWITKVLWVGYAGSDGVLAGSLFGLGIAEFLILVLWWHPMFSFILPLFAYERLGSGSDSIKLPHWLLVLTGISVVFSGPMILFGHGFNVPITSMTILGSVLILVFQWIVLRGKRLRLDTFALKGRSLLCACAGLLTYYLIGFWFILKEDIPQAVIPYFSVLAVYFIAYLLFRADYKEISVFHKFTPKIGLVMVSVFLVTLVIVATSTPVAAPFIVIWYWSQVGFGLCVFIYAMHAYLAPRRKTAGA